MRLPRRQRSEQGNHKSLSVIPRVPCTWASLSLVFDEVFSKGWSLHLLPTLVRLRSHGGEAWCTVWSGFCCVSPEKFFILVFSLVS